MMGQYAMSALSYFFGETIHVSGQDGLAIQAWSLGIFAAWIVCFSQRQASSKQLLSAGLWSAGIISVLGFVAMYQWIDKTYMPEDWAKVFVEGGLTALLATGAALMVSVPERWRPTRIAAFVLSILVALRVVFLHLMDTGAQGESFFLNAFSDSP